MKPWVKFGLPALLMVMGFGFDKAVCSAQGRGLCEAIIIFRVRDARTGKSDESAVQITISGVNDPPFVANPLQDLSLLEDEASELQIDIGGVFDDIDLHTNMPPTPAEALSFSVGGAASFIDVVAVQGSLLAISLLENRHGVASITVSAQDRAGVTAQDMFAGDGQSALRGYLEALSPHPPKEKSSGRISRSSSTPIL